ncbi:cyclic AMP-responsive element-binding protein 3-like protein 3-A [Sardina pilchardus]|uniref:cyclic AMP-responsive element-binding protein 3-like protein 3-A n=1 Tax=Sardina pilchardus TaxID=27697 RepID=UPI002E0D6D72
MELLDLLMEQQPITMAQCQGDGGHGNHSWPITDLQQPLPPAGGGVEDFLDSLLDECVSGPSSSSSPLWAPSPSDSGISDDPQSDQLDSPPPPLPPASPCFDQLYFPPTLALPHPPHHPHQNHHLPPLQHPQQQLQSLVTGMLLDATEPDISIDLGGWDPSFFSSVPPLMQQMNSSFPLTVKDLLLSGTAEQSKQSSPTTQQDLVLNEDEKKLLTKEGVSLPTQLPLTKYEEKILKKIRRKIRNKQSAQESRKKKKEYIDGLEARMAACNVQNQELQRKVFQLEKNNTSLLEQLRRLQSLVMSSSNKPAQTGTCILVLLLSFSLILFPSLKPLSRSRAGDTADISSARVHSRSLRSVVEVHFSPQHPQQADTGAAPALLTKLKLALRPGYADMELTLAVPPPAHNHTTLDPPHPDHPDHPDHLHHHDPITGRGSVGAEGAYAWMAHPDAALLRRRDNR